MKDYDKVKNSLSYKVENTLIDEFYNEVPEKVDNKLNNSCEVTEFKSKLNSTRDKISVLDEDIFNLDIDTLSIIEKGEYIRENKKSKIEFILFVLSSFLILSLYAISIITLGSKVLIVSQIIVVIIAPWIVMAILVLKRRGSEV